MNTTCQRMKYFLVPLLSCAALYATPCHAADDEKIVNFYNWGDYIADNTIANFEKETGIKVNFSTFDSSEIVHTKLVAGHSGYDVVMSSTGWGKMQADGGLLRPLDKSLLPNLKNLDPVLQAKIAVLDTDNRYLVSWLWGYTTVGINVEKVKAALGDMPMPENAWDLLLKPEYVSKLKSCGVSFLDSGSEVLPVVLHYLGKPLDSTNPADYSDAAALLKTLRPSVTLFSSLGWGDDLARGSLCAVMGWSGDIARAQRVAVENKTGQNIQALIPNIGGVLFFDTMVIPVDAPHAANAHKFINYILRPEVHAELTNKVLYANANKAAKPFVKPEIASNPTIFPSDAQINRMGIQGAVNNQLRRLMSRTFTNFKTGR